MLLSEDRIANGHAVELTADVVNHKEITIRLVGVPQIHAPWLANSSQSAFVKGHSRSISGMPINGVGPRYSELGNIASSGDGQMKKTEGPFKARIQRKEAVCAVTASYTVIRAAGRPSTSCSGA